jgi:hypothetical protein
MYRLRRTMQQLMITIMSLVGALKQRAPIQGHLHTLCPNMLIPTEYTSSLATTLASRSSGQLLGEAPPSGPCPVKGAIQTWMDPVLTLCRSILAHKPGTRRLIPQQWPLGAWFWLWQSKATKRL